MTLQVNSDKGPERCEVELLNEGQLPYNLPKEIGKGGVSRCPSLTHT
jgi:hypothetical protein